MMRSLTLVCAGICAGILWVGCGAVEDNPNGGSFSLNATPSSLDVPIASSGKVTVAIDRVGSVADVMLSAQNLPSGITATFATNPVPAGMSASEVTFAVAPGTPAGSSNITIVGSAGGTEKTATVTVNAQTITVSGKIRGNREGITVRIPGKEAVTSGPGGTFTFTNVSPPYDLYTVADVGGIFGGGTTRTVHYFQALTRPDPVVSAPQGFSIIKVLGSTGAVNGTKSGTADNTNPMVIAWSSGGSQITAQSAYAFTAFWAPQAKTYTGKLYGFQFSKKATGAPDVFTGYASQPATLAEGTTPTTVNLVMSAPATAALTGKITPPAGFPNPQLTLTQQVETNSVALWTGMTTDADATIPLVGAGKAALYATASLDGATTSYVHPALAAATDVTFALAAPSLQTAPLNAAVNVNATTQFTWSAAPNTVYEVNILATAAQGSATAGRYQLYTTATTATIPVVPELALPPNQSFTWNVNGYGPHTTINDAASVAGLEPTMIADFEGDRHWFTNSTDRTFTTAP